MSAILLRFTRKFRKLCAVCRKPFLQQDTAGDPSFCSYSCGVKGQPDHVASAIHALGQHKDEA